VTENKVKEDQIKMLQEKNETNVQTVNRSHESVAFIERVVANKRNFVKEKIERLVSDALTCLYGIDYKLEFTYSIKNNRTSVAVELVKKTPLGEIRRELDGFGGGVADIISFPLKLRVLLSAKGADRVLLTDEPGKHIDLDRIELFGEFLQKAANELGVQIIICSHHDVIASHSDCVYDVSLDKDGKSEVRKIKGPGIKTWK